MHRSPSLRRTARGAVMLEALIASAVFAIGITGAYQGIIIASRQNSMANRMVRGAAISSQIRAALDYQGYPRLTEPGKGVLTSACSGSGDLADGLEVLPGACVIDLDAFENGPPTAGYALMPGHLDEDKLLYKRVLVTFPPRMDSNAPPAALSVQVMVVVSWNDLGRRRFHRQLVTVLAPNSNTGFVLL